MNKYTTPDRIAIKKSPNTPEDDIPAYENFRCEVHPNFKVDALCMNEDTGYSRMLCIKCIIEADSYNLAQGDKLITIKELIGRCHDLVNVKNSKLVRSRGDIQDRFVAYLTKSYLDKYEESIHSNLQTLDAAIEGITSQLKHLRDKYRDKYYQDLAEIKLKDGEIKATMQYFIDEAPQLEETHILSMTEVNRQLDMIQTKEDLQEVMANLYLKSRENVSIKTETDFKSSLDSMDMVKNLYNNMKPALKDAQKIGDLTKYIDSIIEARPMPFLPITARPDIFQPQGSNSNSSEKMHEEEEFKLSPPSPKYVHKKHPQDKTNLGIKREEPQDDGDNGKRKLTKMLRFMDIDSHSLRTLSKKIELDESEQVSKNQAVAQLCDWVNRRVTSYLVFQNTISHNEAELGEKQGYRQLGVHLNSITGLKWRNMNKEEKAEYGEFAKEARKAFRKEIEEYENYDDMGALIEKLDGKIKKVRKE